MPQMMPLYWTMMLMFTTFMLLLISCNLYFLSHPSINQKVKNTKLHSWTWMW